MSALEERATAAFQRNCAAGDGERSHCLTMGSTLDAYAKFHHRMFAPETPCGERRVLIVRESFSDVVGVGHAHMGLQRFMALGLALGRAVVFSHCWSHDDPWQLGNKQLFKSAFPYRCDEPHLSVGDHYVGHGGIDLRWSPERQRLMKSCGHREKALDLNRKTLPQFHGLPDRANVAHGTCSKHRTKGKWKGCDRMWNHDQMNCDVRAKGHCPDAVYLFGPRFANNASTSQGRRLKGTSGGGGASGGGGTNLAVAKGSKVMRVTSRPKTVRRPAPPYPREWYNMPKLRDTPQLEAELHGHAMANVLGLYNARRDGGAYGLPTWQISVANGAATVGAPNGSTVGIASEAELRDALTCPYSCWAHANFQPAGTLRALIQRAARKLSRSEPLTCAHMRTMWVDDQRCVPNPRGCHQVEFRRLVYWNTSGSMQHGSGGDTYASSSGARGAIDGNPDHFSTTMGHRSPLWWRVEVTRPLPICRVVLRVLDEGSTESERQMSGAQSGGNGHHGPKRLRVSVLAADALTVVWSTTVARPLSHRQAQSIPPTVNLIRGGADTGAAERAKPHRVYDVVLPNTATGKFIKVEMAFDERRYATEPAALRLRADVYTDEPLNWRALDSYVVPETCRLVAWRGSCPGAFHQTMLPLIGGWSGLARCMATSRAMRTGLMNAHSRVPSNMWNPEGGARSAGAARHGQDKGGATKKTIKGAKKDLKAVRREGKSVDGGGARDRSSETTQARQALLAHQADLEAANAPLKRREGSGSGGSVRRTTDGVDADDAAQLVEVPPRNPFAYPPLLEALGRRLGLLERNEPSVVEAGVDDGAAVGGRRLSTASTAPVAPAYFSTDSPALQQLILQSFPEQMITIEGEPMPSWASDARNGSHAAYAKVLADFEMLKLCDVIFGPVSSNYAKTAAVESMVTRGYLTQHGACSVKRSAATAASTNSSAKDLAAAALWKHKYLAELKKGGLGSLPPSIWRPSVELFEKTRGVEGMFSECRAQD